MPKTLDYLSTKPRFFIMGMGFILVLCIALPDFLLRRTISMSIFYLFPIILTTWLAGRVCGIIIAAVSALMWLAIELISVAPHAEPLVPYWNAFLQFGVFIIVLLLFDAFRREKISARLDYLTGLGNRRQFFEHAETEINRLQRYEHSFTVAYIDVDNFKAVNDRYGHTAGDKLLKLIAEAIRVNIRVTDSASRLGGDEFALILPETDAESAEKFFGKLNRHLYDAIMQSKWPVTLSIGIVTYVIPPATIDEMVRIVDKLMYSAKSSGKNQVKYLVYDKRREATTIGPRDGVERRRDVMS